MLAQKFGGGTADMEFEALTGMSMGQFAPQVSIAYQMVVPNYDSFPSAVQLFEDRGHGALAIHPFTTGHVPPRVASTRSSGSTTSSPRGSSSTRGGSTTAR